MTSIRLALALVLLVSQTVWAQDYAAIVAPLNKSVLRVAIQKGESQGTCSAVVFKILDGRAHALTAAHCVAVDPGVSIDLTVDGRSAKPELSNRILDLAIVTFRPNSETATVPLAPTTPPAGSVAICAGYGFGLEGILYQFGHVARPLNQETKQLWLNVDLLFGDSGGAILDGQGRLIGITSAIYSQGPAHMGGAVPIEQVADFLGEYEDHLKDQEKKR